MIESVALTIQKIVEFLHQVAKFLLILFYCDPFAEDLHAFSFVRGHWSSKRDGLERFSTRRAYRY